MREYTRDQTAVVVLGFGEGRHNTANITPMLHGDA